MIKFYKRVKAIAALRGRKVGDVINKALRMWLSIRPELLEEYEEIEEEAKKNREIVKKLRKDHIKRYKGKIVAIAQGRIIGFFESFEEAAKAIEECGAKHGIIEQLTENKKIKKVDLGWSLVEL